MASQLVALVAVTTETDDGVAIPVTGGVPLPPLDPPPLLPPVPEPELPDVPDPAVLAVPPPHAANKQVMTATHAVRDQCLEPIQTSLAICQNITRCVDLMGSGCGWPARRVNSGGRRLKGGISNYASATGRDANPETQVTLRRCWMSARRQRLLPRSNDIPWPAWWWASGTAKGGQRLTLVVGRGRDRMPGVEITPDIRQFLLGNAQRE